MTHRYWQPPLFLKQGFDCCGVTLVAFGEFADSVSVAVLGLIDLSLASATEASVMVPVAMADGIAVLSVSLSSPNTRRQQVSANRHACRAAGDMAFILLDHSFAWRQLTRKGRLNDES